MKNYKKLPIDPTPTPPMLIRTTVICPLTREKGRVRRGWWVGGEMGVRWGGGDTSWVGGYVGGVYVGGGGTLGGGRWGGTSWVGGYVGGGRRGLGGTLGGGVRWGEGYVGGRGTLGGWEYLTGVRRGLGCTLGGGGGGTLGRSWSKMLFLGTFWKI